MQIESNLSSPHRRSNASSGSASPTYFKRSSRGSEFDSWPILFQRHRYLLTALALLSFLCTIYLYFAVTLGDTDSCSGFSGTQKKLCQLKQAKTSLGRGKMKLILPS